MKLPNYFGNVIVFFIVGIIIGAILDIFRSIRKIRKPSSVTVALQDIIYFAIIFVVMAFAVYFFLDDEIRVYIIMSVAIGVYVYYKLLSKIVMKLYIFLLKSLENIINFILLPFKLLISIIIKISKNLYKFVKKCCIKISNMLLYLWKKIFMLSKNKQKKKVKYERKFEKERKI